MAEQQKFTVKISSKFDDATRVAIGLDIIDHIIARTQKGKDKNNKSFAGYSDSYASSLSFKLAGKSKGKVDLTASEEMLNSLVLLESSKGSLTIGIPSDDTVNNAKAEGNIKGTYGQSKPVGGKKRDFMGIKRSDLSNILSDYPINNKENRDSTAASVFKLLQATKAAEGVADSFLGDGFTSEL